MDHPAPVIAFAAIVSVARLKIRLHGHSGFQFSTKATSARRAGGRGHTPFFALTPMWSAFRGLALPWVAGSTSTLPRLRLSWQQPSERVTVLQNPWDRGALVGRSPSLITCGPRAPWRRTLRDTWTAASSGPLIPCQTQE